MIFINQYVDNVLIWINKKNQMFNKKFLNYKKLQMKVKINKKRYFMKFNQKTKKTIIKIFIEFKILNQFLFNLIYIALNL